MQGKSLTVFSWTHRQAELHLVTVLPDGTKSLIPATWTDLDESAGASLSSENKKPKGKTIGSISHLLHARKVVDAMLNKLNSSEQHHTNVRKEDSELAPATTTMANRSGVNSKDRGLGKPQSPTEDSRHNRSCSTNGKGSLFRKLQRDSGEKE